MSDEVEAAIEETAATAKQLLFNRRGKLKGPEARVALYTLEVVLPKAGAAELLDPQLGQTFFVGIASLLLGCVIGPCSSDCFQARADLHEVSDRAGEAIKAMAMAKRACGDYVVSNPIAHLNGLTAILLERDKRPDTR